MTKAFMYKATWQGVERTLSLAGWYRLTGKSATFLKKHVNAASDLGLRHDQVMDYALAQEKNYSNCAGKYKYPNKDLDRIEQEQARQNHKVLMNMARRTA